MTEDAIIRAAIAPGGNIEDVCRRVYAQTIEQAALQADDESECEDGEYYIARVIAKRIRALANPEGA